MENEDKVMFNFEGEPENADMENENSTDLPPVDENQNVDDSQKPTTTDETPLSEEDKKQIEEENQGEGDEGGKKESFAGHPAWKEREETWKERFNEQEKRHAEDIAKIREDVGSLKSLRSDTNNEAEDVPSWFGGDEDQWKEFQGYSKDLKKQILDDISNKNAEEQKRRDEASAYMESEIKAIENETGEKLDQNKLLKFVLDNELVDSKGNWNYKVGYKLMKAESVLNSGNKNSEAIEEKKKVAGATTSENKSEKANPDFKTSDDFKQPGSRPW